MPINAAVLALVLIFIPGILCYGVVSNLASKRTRDNTTIFLQIFMYGVASYMVLALSNKIAPTSLARLSLKTATAPATEANLTTRHSGRQANAGTVTTRLLTQVASIPHGPAERAAR